MSTSSLLYSMVLAAEIPDPVLGIMGAIAVAIFIGMASWALLMLVKLSAVVAGMEARHEERSADHERRITVLEAISSHPFSHGATREG